MLDSVFLPKGHKPVLSQQYQELLTENHALRVSNYELQLQLRRLRETVAKYDPPAAANA